MPVTPHAEQHFSGSQLVRDAVIGMADGLTVPFALAAGLSGAVDATRIVVTAGMAEIAAGSIAMGLGGYLAARSDAEHYHAERAREEREVVEKPEAEVREVEEVFAQYGLQPALIAPVVAAFKAKPSAWVDFMMRFELGLEVPDPSQALRTAGTIAAAYILGGLVPLASLLWLAACSRFRAVAAVLAGAAFLGSIAAWDARTPWSRFVERAGEQENPFRRLLTPHAQVFWPAPNGAVWLVLGTATWFTVDQGAGIAFHRSTAIEYNERMLASEGLRSRIQNCAMAYPAECRIDAPVATALCQWRRGPGYLVLNGRIDGHAAIAEWRIPRVSGSNQSTVFLYACRDLAGGNRK